MDKLEEIKTENSNKEHNHVVARKKWIRNAIIVMLADIVSTYFAFFIALLLRFDFSFDKIEEDYIKYYLTLLPVWCFFVVSLMWL